MNMKIDKYKFLFECLDSDKDILISYDKIKLKGINNDISTVILPLLEELYETKKSLNFKIFYAKIKKLFSNQKFVNIIESLK